MSLVKRLSCLGVLAIAMVALMTAKPAVARAEEPAPAPEQLTGDPDGVPADQLEDPGDEPSSSGNPEDQTNWRRWRYRTYYYSYGCGYRYYYYRPCYYYYPCYYYRPCVTYTYWVPYTVVLNGKDGANGEAGAAAATTSGSPEPGTLEQVTTPPTLSREGSNDLSALRNSLPGDGSN